MLAPPRSQTLFGNAHALATLLLDERSFGDNCFAQTEFGNEENKSDM